MTVGTISVGTDTSQVVQHAAGKTTLVLNVSDHTIIYLSDKPVVFTANAIPLSPGYGMSVAGGMEMWARVAMGTGELVVANGVGPIFATGVV